MPPNTITLHLNALGARRYADALERGGLPAEAESLRARIPLEGPAPWRKVVSSESRAHIGVVVLTDILECGHTLRFESKTGSPEHARRRRCQACQNDLRRAAGWEDWQIEEFGAR